MVADGRALHAAVFPVQPWLDVPGLGFAALVCADGQVPQAAAETLADMAWAARRDFDPRLTPLSDCIQAGLTLPGMTLVGDAGDGPTGGAIADRPEVLRALIAAGAATHDRPILLTLCDSAAVREAVTAGVGQDLTVSLGASVTGGVPVTLAVRVHTLSDGRFIAKDAGARGTWTDHGPTAVLGHGALRIAVRSVPGREWDTNLFRSLGLEPADAALVFVKSPGHFRVAFGPLATRIFMADTPGPTVGDMTRVAWTRVTRPLFPLDPL